MKFYLFQIFIILLLGNSSCCIFRKKISKSVSNLPFQIRNLQGEVIKKYKAGDYIICSIKNDDKDSVKLPLDTLRFEYYHYGDKINPSNLLEHITKSEEMVDTFIVGRKSYPGDPVPRIIKLEWVDENRVPVNGSELRKIVYLKVITDGYLQKPINLTIHTNEGYVFLHNDKRISDGILRDYFIKSDIEYVPIAFIPKDEPTPEYWLIKPMRPVNPINEGPILDSDKKIYDIVEEMPQFIGGVEEMERYFNEHLEIPEWFKKSGVKGNVIVMFIVEKNGKLSKVQIASGLHPAIDSRVIKMIKEMPYWQPGVDHGFIKRVFTIIPVKINTSE